MKKNNFRKVMLFAFSAFALALGVGGAKHQAPVPAKAVNITSGKVIYFQPSDKWLEGGAYFSVWFFNDTNPGNNMFVDMKREASTSLYSVTTPTCAPGYEGLIFTRQNPGTPTGWNDSTEPKELWNKTADLTFDGTNDVFVMNAGSYSDGSWRKFNEETDILPEIPASTDLYIRPSGTFMDGANRVAAYFYNTDGKNDWVSATEEEGGLYKVVSPTLADGVLPNYVIFASMKSDTTGNNWDNKQDQTADLLPDLTKPVFDHASSSWQVLPTIVTPTPTTEGITSSKMRIWVNRAEHYAGEPYEYMLRVGDVRYGPTGYEKSLQWDNEYDGLFFPYFDVNISDFVGKEVGLSVRNAVTGTLEVDIPAQTFNEGDNNKIFKPVLADDWSYVKESLEGLVHNTFVAKVLEGYLTCSASVSNGYGAFPAIDENFIPRTTNEQGDEVMNVKGFLDQAMINDYANTSDYDEGTNKTVEIDAWTKYQALQQQYNNNVLSGAMQTRVVATNNSLLIATIVIAVLGISLIAYISYRKKLHA